MCNLYSLTKGQAAICDLFSAKHDRTGNLPLFPAIFPDQLAPIIRRAPDGERELVMARWGMPGPPQFGGAPVTNIRDVGSPHWRRWLAARELVGTVASGKDPASERKSAALEAKRDALTLRVLIDQWAKLHLLGKRPNYSTAAVGAMRRTFGKHLDKPSASLDRATVVRVLDGLAKDGSAAMAGATAR